MQQRVEPGKDDGLTAHGADMLKEARLRLFAAPLAADALRASALRDGAALMEAASAAAAREALRREAEGAEADMVFVAAGRATRAAEQAAALKAEADAALPVPERVAGRATIYGLVAGPDGRPVEGLTVAALDARGGEVLAFACSSRGGAYRIELAAKEPLSLRLQVSDRNKKALLAPAAEHSLASGGLLRRDLVLAREAPPGCEAPPKGGAGGGKPATGVAWTAPLSGVRPPRKGPG